MSWGVQRPAISIQLCKAATSGRGFGPRDVRYDVRMHCVAFRLRQRPLVACVFASLVLALELAASPQSTRALRESPIKRAIAQLIDEARAASKEDAFVTTSPDFAKRFDGEIPNDDLIEVISRAAHKEPFIDAYVRWQLTSFEPSWSGLDDTAVLKLMATTPKLLENPRANTDAVDTFTRVDSTARMPTVEFRKLKELTGDLTKRTEKMSSFNTPAEGYRDWVQGKIEESGSRTGPLLWLIERTHATISAGWPSRSVKAQMTKDFKSAGLNRDITPQQREVIAEQTRKLIGLKRTAINEITFMDSGSVNVTFSTYAVDEDDVEKWIALLHGQSD